MEHTGLHHLVKLAHGGFQGRMSTRYWNLVQQADKRDNDRYPFLVSLFKENSVANVVKGFGPNHLEIRGFPFASIYHAHREPLKGRRAAHVPWSRASSHRQAALAERTKRKGVADV